MSKVKEKIAYKKEKVVLSDILPYEVPVIFSNRYFYRFLVENKIEWNGEEITSNEKGNVKKIIELIFPIKQLRTIPFEFRISHKNNSYRSLAITHPINQLEIIAFYDEFKETIKYFSNISDYSIRKPYKVAKTRFINDYLHEQQKDSEIHGNIEINKEREEHLKTFFTYKKYSNIHKFFESHEYQRSEKKFKHLYKFDISKCFDSIYTHSLSWALYNKEIVKDDIKQSKTTFSGKFDALMQNMNYGETNGILIGSEVSRIFAELLLQQIDKSVFDKMFKDGKIHKRDYQVFRYVDDYFLFYNDENIKNKIFEEFIHHLKQFNLFINESKSYQYSRPIVTELTIVKTKMTDLIDNQLNIKVLDKDAQQWGVGFNHKNLITRLKIILKENNIEYKDIVNYLIAVIEKKVLKVLSKIEQEDKKEPYLKDVLTYIHGILDFVFFVYSVAPRVSATIKVVSIMSKLLVFIKESTGLKKHQKEYLFKKMFDEMYQIIKTNKNKKYVQNETLYLLITLSELGEDYKIEEALLQEYFDENGMDYFSITTLLFYIKNQDGYIKIKSQIIEEIKEKFKKYDKTHLKKHTELIMLLLDLLSCPFVDDKDKECFLRCFGVKENYETYIQFRKEWFIKWEGFNLANEMEVKKSQEVYA